MSTDWSDKKEVLKAVHLIGLLLKNASDNLKDDKEVVLAAVNSDGRALTYASDNLKADKEIELKSYQITKLSYLKSQLRKLVP